MHRFPLSAVPLVAFSVACGAPPEPPHAPASQPPSQLPPGAPPPEPAPVADGLRDLVMAAPFARMTDCGHDGEVDGLHCVFSVAGESRPAAPAERLRWFVTDPPGLVLAAVDFEPQRELGDERVMVAECELEVKGSLRDVHLGAAPNITGYRYTGEVEVGRATACRFEPRPALGDRLAAAHVLIPHRDAQRAGPAVTRTRDEAAERAREVARRLDRGDLDFRAAALEYSEEAGVRQSGGDIGTFDLGTLAPEVTFIILGTPIGARSAAFESAFGFHVIERRDPRSN